ncbi:sigma-54-dependent transcriptional regulator [Treponema sp.]|uniref:sigma-54-dependent transcriptional regulator n=1 Tax=Treponema sp. TaxID=166 RepID=UPI00298E77CC|nr:sigma 54-interacting transcriptional regulator [Treponema sp.]MCR5614274.1 sigma 54-interacting transcriptional regulator [Treponema sp.]
MLNSSRNDDPEFNAFVKYYHAVDSDISLVCKGKSPQAGSKKIELEIDRKIQQNPAYSILVGQSELIKKVKRDIYFVKDKDCKVLFAGESGTGKSLAARVLHNVSQYGNKRFVNVNVGALHREMIETTLFGSVKGAYTDAQDRKGLISMASGGTLFMDEIGELPLSCQPQLLHALDCGSYRRVGSDKEELASTRFVFATNSNLKKLVSRKKFREDLYWRIAEFVIEIPALRERKEDIIQIAESFLAELNEQDYKNRKYLCPDAKDKLLSYNWPGNIRELRTCLKIATIYSKGDKIEASDIRFV